MCVICVRHCVRAASHDHNLGTIVRTSLPSQVSLSALRILLMNAQQYSMLSKCAESFTTWVVVVQFLVMLAMWNCITTPLAENKDSLIITMIQLPNTIQCNCSHCRFAYVCMSCAIQLNLVHLYNLSLFTCSCVLWPSLTVANALWQ